MVVEEKRKALSPRVVPSLQRVLQCLHQPAVHDALHFRVRGHLVVQDATGTQIGTPSSETLAITPANTWKMLGKQVDPPDTAVGAQLTIATAPGAAVFLTAIEVSTVNVALEARVAQIEARLLQLCAGGPP